MTVTVATPRELLVATYESTGTATGASAATGDGIALSVAWGGNFTTSGRPLEVECYVPLISTTTGSNTIWAQAHIMVNSVCRLKFFKLVTVANTDGSCAYGKARFMLAAGTYAAAVNLSISAAAVVGYISGTSSNPGLLIVREV